MHPVEPHEVMVTPKSHKNGLPLLISNSVGALTFRASIGGSFAPTVNRLWISPTLSKSLFEKVYPMSMGSQITFPQMSDFQIGSEVWLYRCIWQNKHIVVVLSPATIIPDIDERTMRIIPKNHPTLRSHLRLISFVYYR